MLQGDLMRHARKMLAAAAVVLLLATVASPVALAGSTSNGWTGGEFYWCDPGSCTYWFSTSDGTTTWTTTAEHSEGQNWYQVAPFQQAEFLTNGVELHADGIYPQANWYSVIKYPDGSVYMSDYVVSGPPCYTVAYPASMLAWVPCSSSGFSMSTSTYPPGSAESHYIITAYGVTGSFGGVYSGSLY